MAAYNPCDGTHLQNEMADEAGPDGCSLSRSVNRWLELGILFRIRSEGSPTAPSLPVTQRADAAVQGTTPVRVRNLGFGRDYGLR